MQTNINAEAGARQQADTTLQGNIDTEEARAKAAEQLNADGIAAIEDKIPATASDQNKLVDEQKMNSSIATATATYRGAFNLVTDLHLTVSATEADIINALAATISGADNNDYCFVQIPVANDRPTEYARIERYRQWRYNTDGIDICNCRDVRIENCYIHAFDDAITVKGVCDWDRDLVPEEKRDLAIDNIVIDSCTLWCGWGRTCEVGVESSAPEMKNIVFRNCDCIRNAHAALDARAGWGGHIHHVLFENIRVELHADFQRPVLQKEDGHVYDPEESKYRTPAVMFADDRTVMGDKAGKVSDVTFRDIYVIAEDGVPRPEVSFVSYQDGVSDITVEGLYYNGERQTDLSRFDTEKCNVAPMFS